MDAKPQQSQTEQPPHLAGVVARAERRWVIVFAVLVVAATSLPTILGYTSQGDAWRFTGFVFAVEDGNSYLAKMSRGAAGEWLFQTPYTATPQRGAVFFLPYLLLGKLAAPPGLHEQLTALYHLFRMLAGVLAILATYDFLAELVAEVKLRRWGTALAALGGGLGWTLALLGQPFWLDSLPLEFYSPETFGFLAIYGFPHLAISRALLLWGLARLLRQSRLPAGAFNRREGLTIGALWLTAGLAQPLAAAIGLGVMFLYLGGLAAWSAWRRHRGAPVEERRWRNLALTAAWAAPLPGAQLLYQAWALSSDDFLKAWAAQNLILSPHPLHYLLAYGLLLPFAWLGGRRLVRANPWAGWLPLLWVLAIPFLAYAPLNLQRRLVEGVWVALVALALGFFSERSHLEVGVKVRWKLLPALFFLALPSTLMLLWGGMNAALHPGLPVFRPIEEVQAFEYLQGVASPDEVALASYATGNALPAWAAVKVVIGHGPESAGLADLLPQVEAFYKPETPEELRVGFLLESGADYVLWGPEERRLEEWDPRQAAYLQAVFANENYFVFRVVLDGGD